MVSVSYQLWVALGVCMGSAFCMVGIKMERSRIWAEESKKTLKLAKARRSMPPRICGAWVYTDGKGQAHHCVLHQDHAADYHRSRTSMGRRVQDGLTTGIMG